MAVLEWHRAIEFDIRRLEWILGVCWAFLDVCALLSAIIVDNYNYIVQNKATVGWQNWFPGTNISPKMNGTQVYHNIIRSQYKHAHWFTDTDEIYSFCSLKLGAERHVFGVLL